MKKIVFVIILIVSSLTLFSQSEGTANEKRMKYGFNLGINYSNVLENETLPSNASLSNNFGFRLGILADYKISNFLSISPKAEMSFNNSKVIFNNIDGTQTEYEVMPIDLDFMAHFVFKKNNENVSPYFFFGPNVKIPASKKPDNTSSFSTNFDFAIDFGIGLNKQFTYFNFSPELRYSYGLLNVNQHPSIQSLYFHNISLVFNFIE
ncbi:MAG: PorT family protein [Bacteroidales bacterium]|nr:PorT family protein [Bacteroidales bacterium]